VRESRCANAGDSEKMKQGRFAQRKLFDDIDKWSRCFGPVFAKLNQDPLDLCRVN
jgi:hypothetical protein